MHLLSLVYQLYVSSACSSLEWTILTICWFQESSHPSCKPRRRRSVAIRCTLWVFGLWTEELNPFIRSSSGRGRGNGFLWLREEGQVYDTLGWALSSTLHLAAKCKSLVQESHTSNTCCKPIIVAASSIRHEPYSPAWTLGSWVQIPLEAWMSVCVYSVFVLSCVQVAALQQADPLSKESYRLCKKTKELRSGQGPTKRAVKP
jgi:hypothetical protein